MTEEVTYRVSRGWVQFFRWTAYFYAVGATVCLAIAVAASDTTDQTLASVGIIVTGVLAVSSRVMLSRARRESVELSAAGIRIDRASLIVPWASVVQLRERPWRQRIDLIGRDGPLGVCLRYQLDEFSEALAYVVGALGVEPVDGPFGDHRPMRVLGVPLVLLATGGVSLAMGPWPLGALLIVFAGLMLLAEWGDGPPTAVVLTDEAVVVRRWGQETRYRLGAISAVDFDDRTLDIVISLHSGVQLGIRPRATDPFRMFVSIRAAVARAAT